MLNSAVSLTRSDFPPPSWSYRTTVRSLPSSSNDLRYTLDIPGPPWRSTTGIPFPVPETLYQMLPPGTASFCSPAGRAPLADSAFFSALQAASVTNTRVDEIRMSGFRSGELLVGTLRERTRLQP